jgi:RecA/RadA recombinase
MKKELRLINMADVLVETVRWIWYPYLPRGKLTIVQGDPGEGKTSFALALVALLTKGEPLPGEEFRREPVSVIYQTAEDGLADTIKPRLLTSGADCSRVLVIDESEQGLTLSDERLEKAVRETGAKMIILDPLQAYLGGDVDMHRANEVRPVLSRLCVVAEKTDCAVILIGHMNKAQGMKSSYRGLGSIDFRAAARSVMIIGRTKENPNLRIAAHDKSSLAPTGQSVAFEISNGGAICWRGFCDTTVDELLSGTASAQTKTVCMEKVLREMLTAPMPAAEVYRRAETLGISERTVKIAKKNLGVIAEKIGHRWIWRLPERDSR